MASHSVIPNEEESQSKSFFEGLSFRDSIVK